MLESVMVKHETGNYGNALKKAYKTAKKQHPLLIDILDIRDPAFWMLDNQHRLEFAGLSSYKPIEFDTTANDEDYVASQVIERGGTTLYVADDLHQRWAVVFMSRLAGVNGTRHNDECAMTLPLFFHEVGHVSDFANGINIVPGQPLNLQKAEAYAHHFACIQLIEGNLKGPLKWFLKEALPGLAKTSVRAVSEAAKDVLSSDECRRYRAFAGCI